MESHSRQYARLREEQRAKEKDGYKPPEKKNYNEIPVKDIAKNPTELMKLRIDRMMSQPDKPLQLPEPPKEYTLRDPREFNRHIMGSTAAAGSGEFHVYRATRRRELLRQDLMDYQDKKEKETSAYDEKQQGLSYECEAATAKKRLKRQKQKAAKKAAVTKTREEEMAKKRAAAEELEEQESEKRRAARKADRANANTNKAAVDA